MPTAAIVGMAARMPSELAFVKRSRQYANLLGCFGGGEAAGFGLFLAAGSVIVPGIDK